MQYSSAETLCLAFKHVQVKVQKYKLKKYVKY